MKKLIALTTLFIAFTVALQAQATRMLPPDTMVVTEHEVTIKGQRVPYTATAGTQPVWNEEGKPIAALFYTYYERSDVQDRTTRPLIISFNGGPGSASVWMHIAYTGPRILRIDDEGFPVQPYGIRENPHSILDVADIVFVNPVNTGYSRILDKDVKKEMFFGVNEDIEYLAEWINTFVTRKDRWRSPKYLIGESYGTTRVSGLALELQERQWMYLNGVILVSPTELGVDEGASGRRAGPIGGSLRLPYFTAAAWYHEELPDALQQRDLEELLPEVENFAVNELLPVMAMGGFVDPTKREEMAEKMAYYSGLSKETILQHNLNVPASFFWKDLLRERGGYTVGRLDSRYLGIDRKEAGDRPDYNSEIESWLHSFTPAINYYFQNELDFKTDIKYNMFGPVYPWNRDNNNTGANLRQAMAQNPYLKVMIQSGYYDGATKYFDAKYTMWHLDPSGKFKDRMRFEGYRSGHMMYLRAEDLENANEDIREFIKSSLPAKGEPAMYKR